MMCLALIPVVVLLTWCLCTPVERWIRAHAIDSDEGDELEMGRTCAWGTIRALYGGHHLRYFYLRLPSWSWELSLCRDEHRWHQRVLWWTSYRGWSVQLWPE